MANIEEGNQTRLYWTGGDFRVSIDSWINRTQVEVDEAIGILEEFRSACRKQYIAFSGLINGRSLAYDRFSTLLKPEHRDRTFSIGGVPPDARQEQGLSSIASMTQGELLDGLRDGGEFENQHAKALVVFIFHLWEDHFRDRIACATRLRKKEVLCDLMGDIRIIRNAIIHKNSLVVETDLSNLVLLPEIWQVCPGEIEITESMLHSLMEQINAIRVDLGRT